jgi:catalase-peroxidase
MGKHRPFHPISLGNARDGQSDLGVFTGRPETLTNDSFVNLLKTSTSMKWEASSGSEGVFVARNRATGENKWTGTHVDLTFGSNSQLRALAVDIRAGLTQRLSVSANG